MQKYFVNTENTNTYVFHVEERGCAFIKSQKQYVCHVKEVKFAPTNKTNIDARNAIADASVLMASRNAIALSVVQILHVFMEG